MMDKWSLGDFPYKHEKGVCEKLRDDRCTVYDKRPWQCDSNQLRFRLSVTDDGFRKLLDNNCQVIDEAWNSKKR